MSISILKNIFTVGLSGEINLHYLRSMYANNRESKSYGMIEMLNFKAKSSNKLIIEGYDGIFIIF